MRVELAALELPSRGPPRKLSRGLREVVMQCERCKLNMHWHRGKLDVQGDMMATLKGLDYLFVTLVLGHTCVIQ